MRFRGWQVCALLACAGCGSEGTRFGPPADAPLAGYVDPFIGTDGEGQTFPGAVMPWGMASPSPHTTYHTIADLLELDFLEAGVSTSGYRFDEPEIFGFGVTHLSGTGCPDLGVPVVAATTGDIPTSHEDFASRYHSEQAFAGYYAVELSGSGIRAEMTAATRVAALRFSFPGNVPATVTVDVGHGVSLVRDQGEVRIVGDREMEGSSTFGFFCGPRNEAKVHFVMRVSGEPETAGVVQDGTIADGEQANGDAMAFFRYPGGSEPVTVWVGLSWISVENARENLEAEMQDFTEMEEAAPRAWQRVLERVEVEGGTTEDRTRFYTALYHSLIHPNVAQDVDGSYRRFETDEVAETTDGNRYTTFSMWDTYRTLHPLLTLLYPKQQTDMLQTIADMTLAADAPPKWELWSEEVQMMVGDPAAIIVADSYAKGLTDFDLDSTYDVMKVASETVNHRPGGPEYIELGYVPMEMSGNPLSGGIWGPASTTLEYSLSDWALAQLAGALGRTEEQTNLLSRSTSYRTLFDSDTGTLRPKNADGSFLTPYDPDELITSSVDGSGGPGFVEGTAWQYAFMVPHDVEGLLALHGESLFVERLQDMFDEGRFTAFNEPDLGYPYLFTYVDGEWARTQREVRTVLANDFTVEADGIPGNDDTGTLSAWFVFSAMGFYPVTPGLPEYRLGSPLFERVTIHLDPDFHDGDTFVVEAPNNSPDNVFVTSATVNDEAIVEPVLRHDQITSGGVLRLEMSAMPAP